ncbi:MAG: hypothetical protein R8J84_08620 [Mariprofundales bacterium]
MMSITGTQMMGMPQGVKAADGAHVLPWPNGSVVQARLVPGESAGSALLLLAGYRLRAEVPPGTKMGEVWLQIMGRDMPAQFNLLTQFQAHRILTEMLRQRMQAVAEDGGKKGETGEKRESTRAGGGWPRLDGGGLPFAATTGGEPNLLQLQQEGDGGARGVVQRQGDGEQFLLHGRLDLEHLGAVAFALEGGDDQPWRLRVFARNAAMAGEMRPQFGQWLAQQRDLLQAQQVEAFDGKLEAGLPKDRVSQREFTA